MRVLWRIARELFGALVVLVLVALLSFILQTALPGNAAQIEVGPALGQTPAQRHAEVVAATRRLGLNKSYPDQFLRWAWSAAHGNFGTTVDGSPVGQTVLACVGPTTELACAGLIVALLLAVGTALWAHSTPRRRAAAAIEGFWSVMLVMPQFWLGFLLVLGLSVHLRILPSLGYVSFGQSPLQNLSRLVLPAFTLGLPSAAIIFRYLYAGIRDAALEPFATAALAKGISTRRLLLCHVLPNGALPTVTIIGILFGAMLGGVVIVENVFSWPGLGTLLVNAIESQDLAVVCASVLVVAAGFVVTVAIVDLLYGLIDPRTRRA